MNSKKFLRRMRKIIGDTDPQTPERRMAVKTYLHVQSVLLGASRPTSRAVNKGALVREPRLDPENEPKIKNRKQCTDAITALFDETVPEPEEQ